MRTGRNFGGETRRGWEKLGGTGSGGSGGSDESGGNGGNGGSGESYGSSESCGRGVKEV